MDESEHSHDPLGDDCFAISRGLTGVRCEDCLYSLPSPIPVLRPGCILRDSISGISIRSVSDLSDGQLEELLSYGDWNLNDEGPLTTIF